MKACRLLEEIKSHPEIGLAGMILLHNGVVRATSRDGRRISAVDVTVDYEKLNRITRTIKERNGIVEFLAEVGEGRRFVGEDLMLLAIAGDFRENVIPAMAQAIDLIKRHVVEKKEIFCP